MDFKEDLKWLISLLFPIIYNEVKERSLGNGAKAPIPNHIITR